MKLTCEKAEALLKKSTAKLPPRFEVIGVAQTAENSYLAKWLNHDSIERNLDSVSDPENPDIAKAAYQTKGECGFSAIWFNEDEDGNDSIVCETLNAKDLAKFMKHAKMKIIDVKPR